MKKLVKFILESILVLIAIIVLGLIGSYFDSIWMM